MRNYLHVHVLGSGGIHGKVGEVDVGLESGGELDLGLLGSLPHPLQGHAVLGEVDALVLLELGHEVVEEGVVEVLAAEEGVTVGGLDLEDALLDLQDGDIEGATAEIEDSNAERETVKLVVVWKTEGSQGVKR